ncbi:MAG: acyl carrier protein [Nitrospira sp.]|nr:acyl carrier protein [Nitrospira sp.]
MEAGKVGDQIRNFILTQFPLARQRNLQRQDSLLESGVIDSLGILEVVEFLEREFGIAVDDEELVPETFGTIDHLTTFVLKKYKRGSQVSL